MPKDDTTPTPLQVYRIHATDPEWHPKTSMLQIRVGGSWAAVPAGVTAKSGDVLIIMPWSDDYELNRLEILLSTRKGT